MENIINEIVTKIREKYEKLYVSYEYDESENHYEIWYNNKELDSDEAFQLFIGELIYDYLLPKKIFNVSFYYNYEKSKALELDVLSNIKSTVIDAPKRKISIQADGYQIAGGNFSGEPNLFCLAA